MQTRPECSDTCLVQSTCKPKPVANMGKRKAAERDMHVSSSRQRARDPPRCVLCLNYSAACYCRCLSVACEDVSDVLHATCQTEHTASADCGGNTAGDVPCHTLLRCRNPHIKACYEREQLALTFTQVAMHVGVTTCTIGYPRIGPDREMKKALEKCASVNRDRP